ncbi:Major facilitator superfamily domain general substrate transporter [Penicillium concentricum]|uniref:Major facilitator superfamily domain general substrate transporter n=1 Tax=Penicillium concentricum TaxID=293559 RepID=A0A9W9S8F0_9EURO|nr:Major facilitator superfamily domain general substrate transporter [Penicillium concentricum]KAJ5373987.1 Major facilitator superfamily domain general substrate transporter [Penicillium concentricum]
MAELHDISSFEDEMNQPPGTFKLIREDETDENGQRIIVLDPIPSFDPNEPLNWSTMRKTVNFTIVLAMTLIIFTAISIQAIFWQQMTIDMEVTYEELNKAMSVNYVGLATGCIFFIPFAKKYGRRPVYIVSTALLLATSFWSSKMVSLTELYVTNLLQGLAGATNESIAAITIADLFFVHHRGSMNGLYLTCVMIGNFLTPMAAGAQATKHGWRSSYQTMGIFNGILFVIFLFIYEETKYVPAFTSQAGATLEEEDPAISIREDNLDKFDSAPAAKGPSITEQARSHHVLDITIPQNSWRKRLALVTPTPEPIWSSFYSPFCVLIFPAVVFAALQYAAGVAWLTATSSVLSLAFPEPPYLFSPAQIGYTSAGPLVGNIIGAVYGGFLGDRSILYYAKRNKGYYEPEMRLYILHLPAIFMTVKICIRAEALLMSAFFGFGLGSISDAALVSVMDSYREITGDAFTAMAFMRNAVSIGIPFAISPWIQRNGIQNMFIACGMMSLAVTGTIIPMIVWGKSARRALTGRYHDIVKHGHAV